MAPPTCLARLTSLCLPLLCGLNKPHPVHHYHGNKNGHHGALGEVGVGGEEDGSGVQRAGFVGGASLGMGGVSTKGKGQGDGREDSQKSEGGGTGAAVNLTCLLQKGRREGGREGEREEGREEGREGEREEGREGGREGEREEGREGGREGEREEGREGGREGEREEGREGGREGGRREGGKEVGRERKGRMKRGKRRRRRRDEDGVPSPPVLSWVAIMLQQPRPVGGHHGVPAHLSPLTPHPPPIHPLPIHLHTLTRKGSHVVCCSVPVGSHQNI